jgi:hypothetical protein
MFIVITATTALICKVLAIKWTAEVEISASIRIRGEIIGTRVRGEALSFVLTIEFTEEHNPIRDEFITGV